MSYLKFDKNTLINLEQSLSKEMLRVNKSGAYSFSTIVDCNTRKHHGLMVIPIPELGDENHVLVSSLDTTVIQRGAEFNLGLHKYPGDHYSPKGHKYIREYESDSIPRTIYRVGGVILSRDLIFASHENRLLIKYTLLDAHSPTTLRFKPFLAFRSVNTLTRENDQLNSGYEPVANGIKMQLYPGYPPLFMQLSVKNAFVHQPDWYKNIEYMKDQEQGYAYQEDLFVPGTFEASIRKGQSIYISMGTSEISTRRMSSVFADEIAARTPRDSFTHCLQNAAYQFYNKQDNGQRFLIAGYPWFEYRARDMFIALPGCTLAAKNPGFFEAIMETGERLIHACIHKEPESCRIQGLQKPDVLLWAIWAIQEYARFQGIQACQEKYGSLVIDILEHIQNQKHPNLFLHQNNLLYTDGKLEAISWMDSTWNGSPLVPRSGYLVEFNALWYNALLFGAELESFQRQSFRVDLYTQMAEQTKISFLQTFVNPYGYLYDFVDGDKPDWSVRPNMIFAASLPYSMLDKQQRKTVIDLVTKELLTPRGLRSLSPKSFGYNPNMEGTEEQRIRAKHQGAAWPWLIGHFLEAYLGLYKDSGISFAQRVIYAFEEELTERGVGTISEVFNGNPPYRGHGGVSYAMNVGEILRIHRLLKNRLNLNQES